MAGSTSGGLPLTGSWSRTSVKLPDGKELKGDDDSIDRRVVTPDYVKVLRIPLVRGRYLTDQDREGSQQVALVNQAAARQYWANQDVIGQRLTINKVERTVVGIIGKVLAGFVAMQRSLNRLVIGVGMIPRGEVGLIFAQIGLSAKLLNVGLYSSVTLMIILTTFFSRPVPVKERSPSRAQ